MKVNTVHCLCLLASWHSLHASAQTVTPKAEPTPSPEFMDDLRNGLKALLDSVYPEISGLKTFTIPSALTIDGSEYKIPQIVMQTPMTTSASSTSSTPTTTGVSSTAAETSSTATPTNSLENNGTNKAAGKKPIDKRLAIILGVVLGLIALAVLALVLCCAHRRKRRTGYWLKHEHPPSDQEVAGWRASNSPSFLGIGGGGGGLRNHSSRIWSPKDRGVITEKQYAPIDSSAPHMATLTPAIAANKPKGAFFAGMLDRHGRHDSTDTSRSRNGYHTPPQERAVDSVANDGPYARAVNAEHVPLRHSFHGEPAIGTVPNPYDAPPHPASMAVSGSSSGDRHLAAGAIGDGSLAGSNSTSSDEAYRRNRPPTPLLHTMFGLAAGARSRKGKNTETSAAAPMMGDTTERRHSIPRKAVPTPITTSDLPSSDHATVHTSSSPTTVSNGANANRMSNPFASPADAYSHEVGNGGSPYTSGVPEAAMNRRSFADQRGDDYAHMGGDIPPPPPRSPERRHSPKVHYPSGQEVGQFDFGLSREQLRELREADEERGVRPQWSFEQSRRM